MPRLRALDSGRGKINEKFKGGLMCICRLQLAHQAWCLTVRLLRRSRTILLTISSAVIIASAIIRNMNGSRRLGTQPLPHTKPSLFLAQVITTTTITTITVG